MQDILAIGELLIDFIGGDKSLEETEDFKKCFGGAPGNFAIACSRLGLKTSIISRVGNDAFGRFLIDVLNKEGVDTKYIQIDEINNTGLAFVSHIKERQFLFYKGSEMFIEEPSKIEDVKYICFGSIPLIYQKSRNTIFKIINKKRKKAKICFDPNIRLNLWKEDTKKWVEKVLRYVDILLLTEDEAKFIFEDNDLEKIIEDIRERFDIIGIKMGKKGCMIIKENMKIKLPALKVKVVDTTGAGDAWNAGFLYGIIKGFDIITTGKIANICGAFCVSKKGAITALPKEKDVLKILKKV